MGKKHFFYLDPDDRKHSFTSEHLQELQHTIEGVYLLHKGQIRSWLELPNLCIHCMDELDYSEQFDSAFCPTCDAWREEPCGDPECEYCLERPEKPSDLIDNDEE